MSESDKKSFFKNFMLYISKNGTEWAPVYDMKAVRKVFDIKGGTASLGMGMGTKKGIFSYFDIKAVR